MSNFLPPRAKGSYAIAVCDRCGEKVYYDDLIPDGNSPGLMIAQGHKGCLDVKDPWRLPPRKTENIALRHPRPDTDIARPPVLIDEFGNPVDTEGWDFIPEI